MCQRLVFQGINLNIGVKLFFVYLVTEATEDSSEAMVQDDPHEDKTTIQIDGSQSKVILDSQTRSETSNGKIGPALGLKCLNLKFFY